MIFSNTCPWTRVAVDLVLALVIGSIGLSFIFNATDSLRLGLVFGGLLILLGCGAVGDALKSVFKRP